MKILYISHFNSDNKKILSGTIYYVKKMLENLGHDIIVVDDLKIPVLYKYLVLGISRIIGKKALVEREPVVLKSFARQLKRKTKSLDYDLVFAPTSLYYTYYIDKKPMVYYSDATFGGMVDYYIERKDYTKRAIQNGFNQERMSLENANLIILASKWAKDSAIAFHGARAEKIVVINRGANIKHNLDKKQIMNLIKLRNCCIGNGRCNMMFLGTDWGRKGGPLAIDIVACLNEKYNIQTKLYIVGCHPSIPDKFKPYVEIVGFLNKNLPEEYNKLEEVFKSSDFFLLPTRKEAQGISYTEACSWGVPVIATNTGGVSGVVSDGVNGILFDIDAKYDDYAERISYYLSDSESYRELAMSTYEYCIDNLTWDSVGERIDFELKKYVPR